MKSRWRRYDIDARTRNHADGFRLHSFETSVSFVTAEQGTSARTLGVVLLMRLRPIMSAVVAFSLVSGPSLVSAADLGPGGTFIDDNGNVHEGYIEAINEAEVTAGCSELGPQYCPSDNVTRGQMASFLARAFSLPATASDFFDDDDGTTHEDNINRIAEAGITLGFADGTYRPTGTVPRDQMGSFLARAMELDPIPGDIFDDVSGVHEGNINAIADAGVTLGCNPEGTLYCPTEDVRRDQMASFLGRALGLPEEVVPAASTPELRLISASLDGALYATAPAGDDRLFVVEKDGTIALFVGEVENAGKFLDISILVSGGGQQGLLGMAFHPDYATNGKFYVSYTDTAGDSVIAEYTVSANPDLADGGSRRVIMELNQPFGNHNGGMIDFGEDGYLYIGFGDGGSAGDPSNYAEDPTSILGSMVRIDVDTDDFGSDPDANYGIPFDNPFVGSAAGADEVWAYGLRNPWRWSFDLVDDLIVIADVGQSSWEEVNVAPTGIGGINYGWDRLEGTHCFEPSTGCSSFGTQLPETEYDHSVGQSVTGGFVYRGAAMPDLNGVYFYGDASQGWVKSFRYLGGTAIFHQDWDALAIGNVWGFGQDAAGELYILGDNFLYKIVP